MERFSEQDIGSLVKDFRAESSFAHRFYNALSSGYSFELGEKGKIRDFFSFEPEGCYLETLIKEEGCCETSYRIEKLVSDVAYSLLSSGRAYIQISPKFTKSSNEEGREIQVLSAIKVDELGETIKKGKSSASFIHGKFNLKSLAPIMPETRLVEFNIKDLGFKKKYFSNIAKKLAKGDVTLTATLMITNNVEEYDLSVHSKKCRIRELKLLKGLGWTSSTVGLSDSYILYKRIQECELKVRLLNYIVGKLNDAFSCYGDNGKLVAHIKENDYKKLWKDYSDGKISSTELTEILYGK